MDNDINKKLIILVDDNPAILQMGMGVLSDDYRVATAPSAVKLFRLLDQLKNDADGNEAVVPDLIILDIDMPEVDGYQLIQVLKFRPDTKNIPVIFLTGKTDSIDEFMGLSFGAIDYIKKPYEPSILIERIKKHLQSSNENKINK